MTTVQVRRDEKGVTGLTVKGHSGYAQCGSDIVCSAASVLITTCANAMESVAGVSPVLNVCERTARISVDLPTGIPPEQEHDARVILASTLQGFRDIAAQYPRYIQIL